MVAFWIILSFVTSTTGAFTPRYCRVTQRHDSYIDHVKSPSRLWITPNSVSEDDHDDVATGDLSTPVPQSISLYEQDFVAWLDDTAAKLKEGNFAEIDIVSLVEEIEWMAKSDRDEVESRLLVLLTHLWKRMCVDSKENYGGWENTILEQRDQLRKKLKSRNLRNHCGKVFPGVWIKSLSRVRKSHPKTRFPSKWEWSREDDIDAILNDEFWDEVATGDLPQFSSLYEQDLVAWCDDTAAKLKAGDFSEIEIISLVDEIEGLAGRDRRELKSRLRRLLTHILKRMCVDSMDDYWGWELTIREQRNELEDLLEQSPSLKKYWEEVFPDVWIKCLSVVRKDDPKTEFPSDLSGNGAVKMTLTQC
jgi:Domain of unknown function DUF29